MKATGITGVEVREDMGASPAMVNVNTGRLLVNGPLWKAMRPEHRFFVLLHELGHLRGQTYDELKADEWAFREYSRRGYPLSESVFALSKNLSFNRPEHLRRLNAQWRRAAIYDYEHNGNAAALDGSGYVGFNLCLTDKCRKRVNERKAKRQEERTRRIEARQGGRTDRTQVRGETRQVAYEHGIDPRAYISDTVGHVASAAASIGGGYTAQQAGVQPPEDNDGPDREDRNRTYLLIGVVVVVVVLAIVLMLRKG